MNVVGIGRLVADPTIKTENTWSVTKFRIAVDSKRRPKDGGEKESMFVSCDAFNRTGEFIAKWFHKGNRIYIVGTMEPSIWTDKEGRKHNDFRINVSEVDFVDSRAEREEQEQHAPQSDADETGFTSDAFAYDV
jgi:single-strand DNA-binding protein